mmetsp:Transcript_24890/g.68954  ORF Transcript_24890/g.68954 Transcript_24890/m.68954 type:complete len:203 (-) Transcript_24890:1977-2585(-)
MRSKRRNHQGKLFRSFDRDLVLKRLQMICVHHQSRNGSIERHGFNVLGDFFHCLVHYPQRFVIHFFAPISRSRGSHRIHSLHKSNNTGHLIGLPRLDGFKRTHEHFIHAQGIRALGAHNVVWVDNVSSTLGHFFSIASENHTLVNQLLEWFRVGGVSQIEEDLVPKASVEQMQHCVFSTANVQVDWHPIGVGLGTEGSFSIL